MLEALYGRKCNTPVSWDNPDRQSSCWAIFVEGKEHMENIKKNLKDAQDR
jgi:hypothetical protein